LLSALAQKAADWRSAERHIAAVIPLRFGTKALGRSTAHCRFAWWWTQEHHPSHEQPVNDHGQRHRWAHAGPFSD